MKAKFALKKIEYLFKLYIFFCNKCEALPILNSLVLLKMVSGKTKSLNMPNIERVGNPLPLSIPLKPAPTKSDLLYFKFW